MKRPSTDTACALAITGIAACWLLARIRGYALLGWDTFPQIASARVLSWADLIGNFLEETADGVYPHSFYRPIFNLSLAADYALWGIEPFGYHVTDALLTSAASISLFLLARNLLGETARVGPWFTLAAFLLLPVHIETISLASRRMDILCGLFVTLALLTQASRLRTGALRIGLLPALMTALAVGSKEAGVVALPGVVALAVLQTDASTWVERLRAAVRVALPHSAAIALVFAARFLTLGELGGHPSTDLAGAVTRLPWALRLTTIRLSSLVPTDSQPLGGAVVDGVGAAMLLAFLALTWSTLFSVGSSSQPSSTDDATRRTRALITAEIGAVWWVSMGAIYGATGLLQPWYLLLPAHGLALIAGATAECCVRSIRSGHRARATFGLTVVLCWLVLQARYSPLFHPYAQWEHATELTEAYLDGLSERIEESPNAEVIRVGFPPARVEADRNVSGTFSAPALAAYSIPSWARLRFPDRRVEIRGAALGETSREPIPDGIVVFVEGSRYSAFTIIRRTGAREEGVDAPRSP